MRDSGARIATMQRKLRAVNGNMSYVVALVVFVIAQILAFCPSDIACFPDTSVYQAVGAAPIWSSAFLAGGRPFVVPLLYKLCGNNNLFIAFGQMCLSTLCWAVLSIVVASRQKTRTARNAACAVVLLFGLTSNVRVWNTAMLSESISISIMALLVASVFSFASARTWMRAVLLIVVAGAWSFCRDSNAYVVLAMGVLLIMWVREEKTVVAGLSLILLFTVSVLSADVLPRWAGPLENTVSMRILPNGAYTSWFQSAGMPVTDAIRARAGESSGMDGWKKLRQEGNADYLAYRTWLLEHGKKTYVRFLAKHPAYLLLQPILNGRLVLSGNPFAYRAARLGRALPDVLDSAVFPVRRVLLIAFVVSAGCVVALSVFISRSLSRGLIISLIMLLLCYPHGLVTFHGDGSEIVRHSFMVAVQWRLAIWLTIVFALDAILLSGMSWPCRRLCHDKSFVPSARDKMDSSSSLARRECLADRAFAVEVSGTKARI